MLDIKGIKFAAADFFLCFYFVSGLAKRVKARLLLASTSEVYGGNV